jgi:tripartite-type tricarboxylate transporter receptor subunit TctC
MQTGSLRSRAALFLGMVAAVAFGQAAAQAYPAKPISIVVPYTAGSGTDQLARLMAQLLTTEYKVPVIVENKPGANGFIAAQFVAKAAPDGYTLFMTGSSSHAANEHLYKKLPYDPVKDFTPVTLVYKGYMVMLVNRSSPAKTVNDLIAMAKKAPGKLSFGAGSASGRIAAEMFRQSAGINAVHVPYKSNPPALTDLLGGQIDFMFTDAPTVRAGWIVCPTCRPLKRRA